MAMRPGFPGGSMNGVTGDSRAMTGGASPAMSPQDRAMQALRPQTQHPPGGPGAVLHGDPRSMIAGRPPMSGTPPWMGGGAPRAYTPTQNLQMGGAGGDFDPYGDKSSAIGSSGLGIGAAPGMGGGGGDEMAAKMGAIGGMDKGLALGASGLTPAPGAMGPAPAGPSSQGRAQLAQLLAMQQNQR